MRWWLAAGLMLGLLMPLSAMPCDLHPVPERDTGLLMVAPLETSGLFGFYYDTDQDGVPDFALIFQQGIDGKYIAWPIFYFYGMDGAGLAEEVWHDQGGRGDCSQIQLYFKRTVSNSTQRVE